MNQPKKEHSSEEHSSAVAGVDAPGGNECGGHENAPHVAQISVAVNGELAHVPSDLTIRQLLDQLNIRHPAVAVELNREIQPREVHASVRLQDGDRLEIVSLVGGG